MPRKPKIAIVVPSVTEWGGLPTVAMFLYRAISDSGKYEPSLISLAASSRDSESVRLLSPRTWRAGPQIAAGELHGVPFRHVGCYLSEFEFQRYLPRSALTQIFNEFDLLQIVAGTPMLGFVAATAKRPTCLNVATTILRERKGVLNGQRTALKLWRLAMTGIDVGIERAALHKMTHVFAETTYAQKSMAAWLPKGNLSLGPPGIDTRLFHPTTYKENGHILSVGRFSDPRKNTRLLFKSYHLLTNEFTHPPALVLAGFHGPSVEDLEYARKLGILEQIRFVAQPSTNELIKLYQDAALFVLSSNEEGFGIVLIEAMASGLPVVSTRCGGPEDIVIDGESGYLTPINDASSMARKMSEFLRDPSLARHAGQLGRQIVEERFSFRAAGRPYLDKYEQLLA